jgi:glyoxylase I family protein
MGHNQTIGGGGFHHVALAAADFDRSVQFYTQALGFTTKIAWGQTPARAIMLDCGDGNYFEIFERPNRPQGDGVLLHIALRSRDTNAAIERARAAGATVTIEPKDVTIPSTPHPTPVRLAFCKGPDGEIIEFFQNEVT